MKQDTKPIRPTPIFKPTSQRNDSSQHEPSGQDCSERGLCLNHIDMEERIVLVDKNDKEVGTEEKIKAHKEGKLHRAFSVFVFNSKGEKLLQRRAKTKYHSGGLWTNTCCSHPRPGEPAKKAAHRRLKEEMGFDCELKEVFNFTYRAKLDKNLIEHEYDHVFVGKFEGEPNPNPEEIDDWKWIGLEELERDMQENPDRYTYWLREIFDKAIRHLKDNVKLG